MDYLDYISQILIHYIFPSHRAQFEPLCLDWSCRRAKLEQADGSIEMLMVSANYLSAWVAYRQSLAKTDSEYREFAGKRELVALLGCLEAAADDVKEKVAEGLKSRLGSDEEERWQKRLRKVLLPE